MAMLLLLSLCVVTVMQMTSSQSTYDAIRQENDVGSCAGTEQMLSQLVTTVSQLQRDVADANSTRRNEQMLSQLVTAMSQLQTTVSQTQTAISQLQTDVAELKAFDQRQGCTTPDVNSTGQL